MSAGRILFGVAVAAALAAPAPAQTVPSFKTGGWSGYAHFDAQRRFQYCIVYRSGTEGTEYGFRVTPQLNMFVGISNQSWTMEPSTAYEFSVELGDYKKTHRGTVTADRRTTLWIDVGNDADLRRAIAGGGSLSLVGKGTSRFTLALAGSDNAMRKLLACTALYGVD